MSDIGRAQPAGTAQASVSQEHPIFSPFLPPCPLAQGWAGAGHACGTVASRVADITYLPARSGPLYLSLVTDAYSRKILGHHVHEGMHTYLVAMAFNKALKQRCDRGELIHHSDRCMWYCSGQYQIWLNGTR